MQTFVRVAKFPLADDSGLAARAASTKSSRYPANFNSTRIVGGFFGSCSCALRRFYIFNRMHWFWFQPGYEPRARRNRSLSTLHIVNTSILVKDLDMSRPAAGVPYEKETRPSMMMHWLFGPGRNLHLKHTHESSRGLTPDRRRTHRTLQAQQFPGSGRMTSYPNPTLLLPTHIVGRGT